MIVVDSSAVVAIMFGEPRSDRLRASLEATDDRQMSVVNYVECGTVLAGRRTRLRTSAIRELDALLEAAEIELVPADEKQARMALDARIRFGRGFGHAAGLNFGDSFAYALARLRQAPLLFVGDDFARTDIASALS